MYYVYPSADKLPQLYACECVFDRTVVVVVYEHDVKRRPSMSQTHGIPCIRTRDLAYLGRADTFFIVEPGCFKGLHEFIADRVEETSAIHLLGPVEV